MKKSVLVFGLAGLYVIASLLIFVFAWQGMVVRTRPLIPQQRVLKVSTTD